MTQIPTRPGMDLHNGAARLDVEKEVATPGRSTGTHQQKYAFAQGDRVEVTGSKVKFQDSEVILARAFKKNGETWTLRDAQGIPRWSRAKRR
jgi:hypothetical protein